MVCDLCLFSWTRVRWSSPSCVDWSCFLGFPVKGLKPQHLVWSMLNLHSMNVLLVQGEKLETLIPS